MATIRIPLAEPVEGRSSEADKDSRLVNAYKEISPDGVEFVVKRAGLQVLVAAGSGLGNGVYEKWNINGTSVQAITPSGVFSWGVPSSSGCLMGDGTQFPRNYGGMSLNQDFSFEKVYISGDSFAVDLRGDGSIWSWGYSPVNWFSGETPSVSLLPQQLSFESALEAALLLFPGEETLYTIATDLSLWAVGTGKRGLGLGPTYPEGLPFSPVLSSPGNTMDTDWVFACIGFLTSGATPSCAIKLDGTLWGAGLTADDVMEPLGIGAGWTTCASTAGGDAAIFTALKDDGTLWTFDIADAIGTLAQDTGISDVRTFSRIANSGGVSLFALKTDGTLWAKGYNEYGECGIGSSGEVVEWTQVLPGSLFDSIQESSFSSLMCAKDTLGVLWAWGKDTLDVGFNGVLGTGNVSNPTPVSFGVDWRVYAISQNCFLGVRQSEGEVYEIEDAVFTFLRAPGAVEFLLKSPTKLYVLSESE